MKQWDNGYIDALGIVDFKEYNKAFNAMKSAFNGGVDRSMMQPDILGFAQTADYCLHKALVIRRPDMSIRKDPSSTGGFSSVTYDTYNGGWLLIDEFEIDNFKDAFVQWEYGFHYYLHKSYKDNPKKIEIRLLIDGVAIATVTPLCNCMATNRVFANTPITGGNHTISIEARSVTASLLEGSINACLFHITGQQHLVIGRYR